MTLSTVRRARHIFLSFSSSSAPCCVRFVFSLFGSVPKQEDKKKKKPSLYPIFFPFCFVPVTFPHWNRFSFFPSFHLSSDCMCPSSFDGLIVPFSPYHLPFTIVIYSKMKFEFFFVGKTCSPDVNSQEVDSFKR